MPSIGSPLTHRGRPRHNDVNSSALHEPRSLNHELPLQLAARLKQGLPGWQAQSRYQPELSFGRHLGPTPAGVRPAAVLLSLYPHQGLWHVPLILRTAHMLDHASQVSLPGGMIESGETSQEAALREFSEELGPAADDVMLLGHLSELYLFASNYRITPWVGAVDAYPHWTPSPGEVERVLEVPVAHLRDPANTSSIERKQRGLIFSAPCYCWESERIWGATSMVLAEFVACLTSLAL